MSVLQLVPGVTASVITERCSLWVQPLLFSLRVARPVTLSARSPHGRQTSCSLGSLWGRDFACMLTCDKEMHTDARHAASNTPIARC